MITKAKWIYKIALMLAFTSQFQSMREVERKKVGIGKRRIPTEH